MPALVLTPAQRKALRSQAHHLHPVVHLGAEGLSAAVLKETDSALSAHGLIKVRVLAQERSAREAVLAQFAEQLNAAAVQHIGRLLVLWRPKPEKPTAATAGAPRVVKVLRFAKRGGPRPQIRKLRVLGNERVTAGGTVKRARPRLGSVKKSVKD